MRIEIRNKNNGITANGIFLDASTILKYLISENDEIDTKIICKTKDANLITTDKEIYEALGSIKPYDSFNLNKLTKFFENVVVNPSEKRILTFERVEEIRKTALKQKQQ